MFTERKEKYAPAREKYVPLDSWDNIGTKFVDLLNWSIKRVRVIKAMHMMSRKFFFDKRLLNEEQYANFCLGY